MLFYQDNAPCDKSIKITARIYKLHYLSFLPASVTFTCSHNLKNCSQEMYFHRIAKTKVYLAAKDKSFYRKNISLERNYIDE